MSRISARRGKGAGPDWLSLMLGRKPVKLVAVALANRMARIVRH
jgi:transposase